MKYYVTLFDSHYLTRGLCLYDSLCNCCVDDFTLVVITMDEECNRVLKALGLDKMTVVSLDEFEDDELLSVKSSRSKAEYCWSSTAKSIIYVLEKFDAEDCTYIDADIMFFSDPEEILNQIPKDKSVMITEHRYTPEYDQSGASGKYCVQFMFFRKDENGLKALYWWKDRCIEWCGAVPTDGKMGDQMYLNDWPDRFDGIYVMEHLGGGIAPWNVQQYSFTDENNKIRFYHKESESSGNVVFYHFHAIEFFNKDVVRLCPAYYHLPDTSIAFLYKEYVRRINKVINTVDLHDGVYSNSGSFRDGVDNLQHDKNFYNFSLFL